VGVAAAGLVLTAIAVVVPPKVYEVTSCPPGQCGPTPRPAFVSWCELTSADPGCLGKQGLLAAPLGYSLAIAGGALWAGETVMAEDSGLTWLPWVGGVALGTLAYGVSAALNGPPSRH
jgi:hypothetical protein